MKLGSNFAHFRFIKYFPFPFFFCYFDVKQNNNDKNGESINKHSKIVKVGKKCNRFFFVHQQFHK